MDQPLLSRYLHPLAPIPTALKPKGRLRLPVACLLCDLYGTLFISGSGDTGISPEQGQKTALIDLLLARYGQKISATALHGLMCQTIEDEHTRLRKDGIDYPEVRIEKIWETLLPELDPEMRQQLAVEFEMINNPIWVMPGAKHLIQFCGQRGIRLGIISNAQFYTTHLFSWLLGGDAESLGFEPDLILYSFQFGRAKPSKELFETARLRLSQVGIEPTAVAYIGNDMQKDILPAQKAGFQTILFAGDRRSLRLRREDPLCSAIDPDVVVTRLEQLTAGL